MEQKDLQKDLLKIKDAMDSAEEDTKPIAGIVNEELVVRGDVNNTKIEPVDFTARFVFPEFMAKDIEGTKPAAEGFVTLDVEYKNIFPSVRDNTKLTSAMTQLFPFYNKLNENGDIERIDDRDFLVQIFQNLEDDIVDALYRLVQVALGIDDDLIEHLAPIGEHSAIEIGVEIMEKFPSIVNQADLFFASSTEKA